MYASIYRRHNDWRFSLTEMSTLTFSYMVLEIFQKMYTMHVKIALEQPFPAHFTNKLCVRITDSNGRLCFSPGYI